MDLFLKIIGGLALVVGGILVLFLLFLWWGFRSLARNSPPPPSTIDLLPEAEPKWLEAEAVRTDLAAYEALGFARGPAYTVEGIAGVSLIGLVQPDTGVMAVIYQHPAVGNWSELCVHFADGFELTVTNAPMGQQMDTPPNTEKLYHKGMAVAGLHALTQERLAGRETRKITLGTFREEFIAEYARTMAWRNAKSGTSEEEFMRVAAGHDKKLTDEQLREAYRLTKLQELHTRSEEALRAFEKSTTLAVSEWKKYEHLMVVYRDDFHPEAYLDYLSHRISIEEQEIARYRDALGGGLSLKGLMDRVAADTGRRFHRLGELTEPFSVEIYGIELPNSAET